MVFLGAKEVSSLTARDGLVSVSVSSPASCQSSRRAFPSWRALMRRSSVGCGKSKELRWRNLW